MTAERETDNTLRSAVSSDFAMHSIFTLSTAFPRSSRDNFSCHRYTTTPSGWAPLTLTKCPNTSRHKLLTSCYIIIIAYRAYYYGHSPALAIAYSVQTIVMVSRPGLYLAGLE